MLTVNPDACLLLEYRRITVVARIYSHVTSKMKALTATDSITNLSSLYKRVQIFKFSGFSGNFLSEPKKAWNLYSPIKFDYTRKTCSSGTSRFSLRILIFQIKSVFLRSWRLAQCAIFRSIIFGKHRHCWLTFVSTAITVCYRLLSWSIRKSRTLMRNQMRSNLLCNSFGERNYEKLIKI